MNQYNLTFDKKNSFNINNYITSNSNKEAFKILIEDNKLKSFFLYGPMKCGKSHLSNIWLKNNNALNLKSKLLNLENISNINNNILIDDVFNEINEEFLFHLINHVSSNNLKILLTSDIKPISFEFKINDLSSRIKTFYFTEIFKPDDFLIMNLIIKLFSDRQLNLKNHEIINYITKRIDRSFDSVYNLINKIDNYSLSQKREITIPLIKEII